MAHPLLEIGHLRVDFPGKVAVDDLSLKLEGGDLCGLIGPDGSGKTTVLRTVAGLQEITRGSIRVAGHELASEPDAAKQRLGFLPEDFPVYDRLTVREFLDHFARAYGVSDPGWRIHDCLEQTGLEAQSGALCVALSRGMKQRLGLARILLPDPDVLLLDEPARGLDPLGKMELWRQLLQLRDAAKAVLITSHSISELAHFCNKAALIERGRLAAFGTMRETALQTVQRVSVQWRSGGEKALRILEGDHGVSNIASSGQSATFSFAGDADLLHDLLRLLIQQEVHVTEWRSLGAEQPLATARSTASTVM